MNTIEEKVGYLMAKTEEQKSDLIRIEQKVDYLTETVTGKFATAEATFKVLKFVGIVIVALATLQFGDIAKWYTYLFK